jgi:hypothetical protein
MYDMSRLLSFSSGNIKHKLLDEMPQLGYVFLVKSSCHVTIEAYLDSYGPTMNDSTSSWIQKCTLRVDGPK